jgi:hypothetical protein
MKRIIITLLAGVILLGLAWLAPHSPFKLGLETSALAAAPVITATPAVAVLPVLTATATSNVITAVPTPTSLVWKTFKADSGYQISYPLGLYSIRSEITSSPSTDTVWPGPKTLVPDDSFFYREPRSMTYKISIAIRVNKEHLSLDAAETLLTQNSFTPYPASALEGVARQPTLLDGVNALRVENFKGPQGPITLQIVAVQPDWICDIMVEPQQLTGNLAEPFQMGAFSVSNRDWVDKILETFKFVN